jgi:hypothetical protein
VADNGLSADYLKSVGGRRRDHRVEAFHLVPVSDTVLMSSVLSRSGGRSYAFHQLQERFRAVESKQSSPICVFAERPHGLDASIIRLFSEPGLASSTCPATATRDVMLSQVSSFDFR